MRILLTTLLFALFACNGAIGAPGETGDPPDAAVASDTTEPPTTVDETASPSPTRRLTALEYENTLRAIFEGLDVPTPTVEPDIVLGSYDNVAVHQSMGPGLADTYVRAAETVGTWAGERAEAVTGCNDSACVGEWIPSFGQRVLRRPLLEEERTIYQRIYDEAAAESGHSGGTKWVVAAMLQSPHFIYLVESGEPPFAEPRPLNGYEQAVRLSYLFWAAPPDAELVAAAEANALSSADDVEREARRLLADERARPFIARFFAQWLQHSRLRELEKDGAALPLWNEALRDDFATETQLYVEAMAFEEDASVAEFFTSNTSFVNARLRSLYGLDESGDNENFERVELPADERAGLLTQGSFLALHAYPDYGSPIHRGAFVVEHILCDHLPPPDPSVLDGVDLPTPAEDSTVREQLDELTGGGACNSCHGRINPVGFAFERYDGLGSYRERDEFDHVVDDSGRLVGFEEDILTGDFLGPVELADRLGQSDALHQCVAENVFEFTFGREAKGLDHLDVDALAAVGRESLLEMFIAAVRSEVFRTRR